MRHLIGRRPPRGVRNRRGWPTGSWAQRGELLQTRVQFCSELPFTDLRRGSKFHHLAQPT